MNKTLPDSVYATDTLRRMNTTQLEPITESCSETKKSKEAPAKLKSEKPEFVVVDGKNGTRTRTSINLGRIVDSLNRYKEKMRSRSRIGTKSFKV